RARALSVPVSASAITSPAMMNGATVSVSAGSARAIEPRLQLRTDSNVSGSIRVRNVAKPPSTAPRAAPARTSATREARRPPAAPRQCQRDGRGPASSRRPDHIDEHGGHGGAEEREPDVSADAGDADDPGPQGHRERCAGVDPQDPRVRQWVAGQCLDERARDPEGRADQHADNGPGEPERPDDDRGLGVVPRPEPVPQLVERELIRPGSQAQDGGADQRRRDQDQSLRPVMVTANRRGAVPGSGARPDYGSSTVDSHSSATTSSAQ